MIHHEKNINFLSSKLSQSLQMISKTEWKRFGHWLHSPWCNSQQKLAAFYELLKPHYPTFKSSRLNKVDLFAQLYPEHDFDAHWMRNLMSALNKQLEKFLVHERLQHQPEEQTRIWQDILLERGREADFAKSVQRDIKSLSKKDIYAASDFLQLFLLYEKMHRHLSVEDRRESLDYFFAMRFFLEQFKSAHSIRFNAEIKEIESILSEQKIKDAETIFQKKSKNEFKNNSVDFYPLINHPEFDFNLIKILFYQKIRTFNINDQKIILRLLINQAVRRRVRGKEKALESIFELYQFGLNNDLLLQHGRISEVTFANIITAGHLLQEYATVETIVNQHIPHLLPHLQEDAANWAFAHRLYYQKQNLPKHLNISLTQHRRKNTSFSIRAKILLLQIRFDEFIDSAIKSDFFLLDFMAAFEKQINRDKVFSKIKNDAIKNLIQFSRKLFLEIKKPELNQKNIKKLKQEILAHENIRAKNWLINKFQNIRT